MKLSYSVVLCNLLNWPVVHSCFEDDESVELSLLLLVLDCTDGVTDSESDSEMSNSLNACNSSDAASRLRFGIRAFNALFTAESTIAWNSSLSVLVLLLLLEYLLLRLAWLSLSPSRMHLAVRFTTSHSSVVWLQRP